MFDIGFPELLLISIVALLVVGPDRLPDAVRTSAKWIGRFKRSFANIKAEIEKELQADEIRQQIHNESVMADIEKTRAALDDVQSQVKGIVDAAEKDLDDTKNTINSRDDSKQSSA